MTSMKKFLWSTYVSPLMTQFTEGDIYFNIVIFKIFVLIKTWNKQDWMADFDHGTMIVIQWQHYDFIWLGSCGYSPLHTQTYLKLRLSHFFCTIQLSQRVGGGGLLQNFRNTLHNRPYGFKASKLCKIKSHSTTTKSLTSEKRTGSSNNR